MRELFIITRQPSMEEQDYLAELERANRPEWEDYLPDIQAVIEAAGEHGITEAEIAEQLNISLDSVRQANQWLWEEGKIADIPD